MIDLSPVCHGRQDQTNQSINQSVPVCHGVGWCQIMRASDQNRSARRPASACDAIIHSLARPASAPLINDYHAVTDSSRLQRLKQHLIQKMSPPIGAVTCGHSRHRRNFPSWMWMWILNLYSAIPWSISIALSTLVFREKYSLQTTPKAAAAERWITETVR